MPTLPIRDVVEPSVLRGQANGQLPASLLHAVKMPGGGPDALLVEPAARAMRAMVAAAARDGIRLCSTSSYRTFAEQDRLFRDRFRNYDTGRLPAVTRKYEGRTWWLLPGVALAAVPGTSNHGKGLADDLSEQLDGDPEPESISDRAVAWLIANAWIFGYSAEVQSEEWHWRYCTGDAIPAAVLLYESTLEDVMQARLDPATGKVWIGNGLVRRHVGSPEEYEAARVMFGLPPLASVPKATPAQLAALGMDVAALTAPAASVTLGASAKVTLTGTIEPAE